MNISNLKIGFFGASIARRDPLRPVEHFIDNIAKRTNSIVVNDGTILCSEERIYYELKKHKNNIDLAVIFHSDPTFYFTPVIPKRDFRHINERDFDSKINTLRSFDDISLREVDEQANESFFKGTAIDREDFIKAVKYYNRYFFNHDLQINRYQGALVLIDQYLLYRKIPVIHSMPINENHIPKWFSFKTGVIDHEIHHFQNNQYREDDHMISENNINQEGNNIIADRLISLMEDAIKKCNS